MSQPDVRVRRTRALLRQALVELIEDRGFDRVTVGDLTARAMISRAAFYRNYRDKYELVEQIFDEAMAEMTADDFFVRVDDLVREDFAVHTLIGEHRTARHAHDVGAHRDELGAVSAVVRGFFTFRVDERD